MFRERLNYKHVLGPCTMQPTHCSLVLTESKSAFELTNHHLIMMWLNTSKEGALQLGMHMFFN